MRFGIRAKYLCDGVAFNPHCHTCVSGYSCVHSKEHTHEDTCDEAVCTASYNVIPGKIPTSPEKAISVRCIKVKEGLW